MVDNQVANVNETTGELVEDGPRNYYGNTIQAFPKATSAKAKAAQFNALNNAVSLADNEGKPITIVGIASTPGTREVTDQVTGLPTGQVVPTDDTVLLGEDGTGYFTKSYGIAKSIRNLLAAYGTPDQWPDGKLTVKVDNVKTGRGKMKLLNVIS